MIKIIKEPKKKGSSISNDTCRDWPMKTMSARILLIKLIDMDSLTTHLYMVSTNSATLLAQSMKKHVATQSQ